MAKTKPSHSNMLDHRQQRALCKYWAAFAALVIFISYLASSGGLWRFYIFSFDIWKIPTLETLSNLYQNILISKLLQNLKIKASEENFLTHLKASWLMKMQMPPSPGRSLESRAKTGQDQVEVHLCGKYIPQLLKAAGGWRDPHKSSSSNDLIDHIRVFTTFR